MQKQFTLTLLFFGFLFSLEADHIIFNKIVISPDEAQLVSIYNPTDNLIDLSEYYLSDAEDISANQHYYNLPTGDPFLSDLPSEFNVDFVAKFPDESKNFLNTLLAKFGSS